jgi:hypothetical protein
VKKQIFRTRTYQATLAIVVPAKHERMIMLCIMYLLMMLCLMKQTSAYLNGRAALGRREFALFEQLGRVTMYKREGCPHCVKATELLVDKHKLDVTYVDIEGDDRYPSPFSFLLLVQLYL